MEEAMKIQISKLNHKDYITLVDYLCANSVFSETSKPYLLFELESINSIRELPPKYEGITILIAKPKYDAHKKDWAQKVQGLNSLVSQFNHK